MVAATLRYLARDEIFESEKPYFAEFNVKESDGVKKTNYVFTSESVTIQAIKPSDNFDLDHNGFCVITAKTSLDAADALRDAEAVEESYLLELVDILSRHFPEYKRIEPIQFSVRKRDDRFPTEEKHIITHQQPACVTHSDYSVRGARLQLQFSYPGQDEYFKDKEFDMINVWRPLVGPNDDWPLAVCDDATVDAERDVMAADRLHTNWVGENQILFPNARHRWYYVRGQRPDQLLVFRNTDSTGLRAKAFHAAFFNSESQSPPRQSCEARFVAIR